MIFLRSSVYDLRLQDKTQMTITLYSYSLIFS
jgi:hypothetical protein